MKSIAPKLAALLCAVPAFALAQTSVDRSFESAPKDCADVRWSASVLSSFPSIAEACQAVEQRNGMTYVKLSGRVEDVRDQGKRIRVDFKDGKELTFTPTPNTTLYLDGERTPFAELRDGTELNFYVPENRLQAELQPDPERFSYVIVPLDIHRQAAGAEQTAQTQGVGATRMAMGDELPRTAGPLPLIGLGGLLLIGLGASVTLRRKLR